MKLSIITPSFNSGKYIKATLLSIQNQLYSNFEHILYDGNSSDNTLEIISSQQNLKWTSEPDEGQSDAINKGFRLATGDILAWQNADDLYFKDTFNHVVDFFKKNPKIDLLYGDYELIDEDGKWICDVYSPNWNKWLFTHGRFCPVQPAVFWRKSVYDDIGELDLSLHYTMDVDFYSRTLKKYNIGHIPKKLGSFRVHQESKTQNKANRLNHKAEYKKVLSMHFNYNFFDNLIFEFFYQRSQLASFVKRNFLKK